MILPLHSKSGLDVCSGLHERFPLRQFSRIVDQNAASVDTDKHHGVANNLKKKRSCLRKVCQFSGIFITLVADNVCMNVYICTFLSKAFDRNQSDKVCNQMQWLWPACVHIVCIEIKAISFTSYCEAFISPLTWIGDGLNIVWQVLC